MVNQEYLMNLLPQMILVGLTDHEKSSKFQHDIFFKFQVFLKKFFIFFPVTDISDLEQRLRDLPLNNGDIDDADNISIDSEVGPNNFRPWENYAERGLPSCKNH